jgi:hypothetical protein
MTLISQHLVSTGCSINHVLFRELGIAVVMKR